MELKLLKTHIRLNSKQLPHHTIRFCFLQNWFAKYHCTQKYVTGKRLTQKWLKHQPIFYKTYIGVHRECYPISLQNMDVYLKVQYLSDFCNMLQTFPFIALCWSNRNMKSTYQYSVIQNSHFIHAMSFFQSIFQYQNMIRNPQVFCRTLHLLPRWFLDIISVSN